MRCLESLINRDLLAFWSVYIDLELLFVGKNECVERAAAGHGPEGNDVVSVRDDLCVSNRARSFPQ